MASGVWVYPNGPNSKWIAPRADQATPNYNSPGNYTYRTTFDLTGLDPWTASLSGWAAADDSAVIKLNGVQMVSIGGFGSATYFSISSGFVTGVNTLDFVVTNGGSSGNPTGLRVEISGTANTSIGPPTVNIDVPTENQSVAGTILVGGWAIDNASASGAAIANVRVFVDGTFVAYADYGGKREDVCNVFGYRPGCPFVGFNLPLNTSGLTPGTHTITVTATDTDGTPDSNSATVHITVGSVGTPTVFIDLPAQNQSVSGTIQVAGWAIDNWNFFGTPISNVKVLVDGNFVANAAYGVAREDVCNAAGNRPSCPNVGYSYNLNTASLTPGQHNITVQATDTDASPDTGSAGVTVTVAGVTVTSVPPGLGMTVDGGTCISPCYFQWTPGSQHSISAISPQSGGGGTRYVLSSWSPGSGTITAPSTPATYTATFATQFYLTTATVGGGTISPAGNWYAGGQSVTVSASPSGGNVFTGFSGDLSGLPAAQSIVMNAPKSATASFAPPLQILTTSPLPNGTIGSLYEVYFSAAGGSGSYTWTITGLPPGMQFSPGVSGRLYGTPGPTAGTFHYTATVSDDGGQNASLYFAITINPGNPGLSVSCAGSASGQTATFTATGAGGSGGYSYFWSGSWAGASSATGSTYSFTFPSGGTYTAIVTVYDSQNRSVSGHCSVAVQGPTTGTPLTITSTSPLPNGYAGGTYSWQFQANGGSGVYTWSTLGALPPGMTFSANGQLGASSLVYGSYLFRVQVLDSTGRSSNAQFAISVSNPQVSLAFPQLAGGYLGTYHRYTLHYTSPGGPSDISGGQIVFNTDPTTPGAGQICEVDWSSSGSLNMPGLAYTSFGGANVSSSDCFLDAATSTKVQTPQGYDISVNVSFTAQMGSGVIPVWSRINTVAYGTSAYRADGSWTQSTNPYVVATQAANNSGQNYCQGRIAFGASLSRDSLGKVSGVFGARTENVGNGSPWSNYVKGGRLVDPNGNELFSTSATAGPTINSEEAVIPFSSSQGQLAGTYITYGNFRFINNECTILIDTPGYEQEGNDVAFYGVQQTWPFTGNTADPTPYIDSVSPNPVPSGVQVQITGTGFGQSTTSNESRLAICPVSNSSPCVTPSSVSRFVNSWAPQIISASINAPEGDYYVQLTSAGAAGSGFVSGSSPIGPTNPASNLYQIRVCTPAAVTINNRPITLNVSAAGSYPYSAALSATSSTPGVFAWSTDMPSMISFSSPTSAITTAYFQRPGKARITVAFTNSCGTATDSLTIVLSDDVTTVGWLDGSQVALPTGASQELVGRLNDPARCFATLGSWANVAHGVGSAVPSVDLDVDRRYANAFLVGRSANPVPPSTLSDPEGFRSSTTDYRAFNRFPAAYEVHPEFNNTIQSFQMLTGTPALGTTPEPCAYQTFADSAEASPRNAVTGNRFSYVFQVNEGRLGSNGQKVNWYLNKRNVMASYVGATPFIWSSIRLDTDGRLVPLTTASPNASLQVFPTYWVYVNGNKTYTFQQASNLDTFILLDSTSFYQIPPVQ